MKYQKADDVLVIAEKMVEKLQLSYIDLTRVGFIRSYGSKTRNTIARCHGLSKIFEHAFAIQPRYVIEVIAKRFDKLNEREKKKVILHELMHIPKSFGGGFRHHNYVSEKNVEKMVQMFEAT